MDIGKRVWLTILFAIGGGIITGIAGTGVLFIVEQVWPDGLVEGLPVGVTFLVTFLPGVVAGVYWAYFYIKKRKHETKHLNDHLDEHEKKF